VRSALFRHGLPPAIGVVLGIVAGLLVNVVRSRAWLADVISHVVLALVWAGIEAWQSARAHSQADGAAAHPNTAQPAQNPAIQVRMSARQVSGGSIRGIVAPAVPSGADVDIAVGAAEDATIIGIDSSEPPSRDRLKTAPDTDEPSSSEAP